MTNSKKTIQVIVLSVVLLLVAVTLVLNIMKKESPVKVGSKAPSFTLKGLDGRDYLLSDLKGKAVVLNFWGTFCPPCVREMPALQKQYELWRNKNVIVLGVNLNESRITVQSFITEHQITFPILLDKDILRKEYKVTAYPTTFYIGTDGKIKDIFVGEMKETDISSRINKLQE